ncbi:unnamed protein product, partial [Prorocentrum cordatum]
QSSFSSPGTRPARSNTHDPRRHRAKRVRELRVAHCTLRSRSAQPLLIGPLPLTGRMFLGLRLAPRLLYGRGAVAARSRLAGSGFGRDVFRRASARCRASIAFFDCDYTVLGTDCELEWKAMLIDRGVAPEGDRERAAHFMDLHDQGRTPVEEYTAFLLRDFVGQMPEDVSRISRECFQSRLVDKLFSQVPEELARYDHKVLLSGSFRPIVLPVSEHFGFDSLVCSELELGSDGLYTGQRRGPLAIKEAKLAGAEAYCRERGARLADAAFYGDSLSDLPVLLRAGRPHCVNPRSAELVAVAEERGWPVLSWTVARR